MALQSVVRESEGKEQDKVKAHRSTSWGQKKQKQEHAWPAQTHTVRKVQESAQLPNKPQQAELGTSLTILHKHMKHMLHCYSEAALS